MPSCGLQIEMYEIYHLDIAKEQPCLCKNNSDSCHQLRKEYILVVVYLHPVPLLEESSGQVCYLFPASEGKPVLYTGHISFMFCRWVRTQSVIAPGAG